MRAVARAILTVAIALALAVLLITLSEGEKMSAKCIPTTLDEDAMLKKMMERAFDRAFETQIASLYKVYVGNAPSVEEQQQYTRTGILNAIEAWRIAQAAVAGWEGCK